MKLHLHKFILQLLLNPFLSSNKNCKLLLKSVFLQVICMQCVNADVPNAGRGLDRLEYRTQEWDLDFRQYLKDLDAKKPVILCGDLNVAHLEIGRYSRKI